MTGELFSRERSAEVVTASFAGSDPRLREVLSGLVRHLHAFVGEVGLTVDEWAAAVDFLTRTGQLSDEVRQEFILLSDVLGVSMLVESVNHPAGGGSTEATVVGPFHQVASPVRALGDSLVEDGGRGGEPLLVVGSVRGGGRGLAGATVDVWQADAQGFYDVQQPGERTRGDLRGIFRCAEDGSFLFTSVLPRWYPIPDDGPVGELLRATGRHPNRPAHVHFLASAPGWRPVTTHVFVAGSEWLDSDAVFGVRESLVRDFDVVDDPARAAAVGLPNPFRRVRFDLDLMPVDEA